MDIQIKFLSLILFIIIAFVILNQIVKLTIFAYKYYNIYFTTTISKSYCGNYFSESEDPRFQISKNVYDLHIDNDIFNSKSYIIIIYLFSIILCIYACRLLTSYFDNNKLNFNNKNNIDIFFKGLNYFVYFFIIVFPLIYFIVIISFRFAEGEDNGYKRLYTYSLANDYGMNKYILEISFYTVISSFILIKLLLIYFYNENDNFLLIIFIILISAFYIFTLYFMNNLLNIILSFKINEKPLDDNDTIDISYGSENYFYKKYIDYVLYSKYPNTFNWFDIYQDIHDMNKITIFNKATEFKIFNLTGKDIREKAIYFGNIRNFILVIIIIITCLLALIIIVYNMNYYLFNKDYNINNYCLLISYNIILPLLILFIIIFVIVATTEYNTFINKDVLININRKYKEDLFIANKQIYNLINDDTKNTFDTEIEKVGYIVLNILKSYIYSYDSEGDINNINNLNKNILTYLSNEINIQDMEKIILEKEYKDTLETDDVKNANDLIIKNIQEYADLFIYNTSNNYSNIYIDNYVNNNVFKNVDNFISSNNKNIKNNINMILYDDYSDYDNNVNYKYVENMFILPVLDINNKNINTKYKCPETNKLLKKIYDDKKYINDDKKLYNSIDIIDYYNIIDIFIIKMLSIYLTVHDYNNISYNEDEDKLKKKITAGLSVVNTYKSLIDDLNNFILNFSNNNNTVIINAIKNNYNYKKDINNVNIKSIYLNYTNLIKDSEEIIKEENEEILKNHDNIVKNADFVINERLYVLLSTYIIALIIAYILFKKF